MNRTQKIILIFAAVEIIAFLLFCSFLYNTRVKSKAQLQEQLKLLDAEIQNSSQIMEVKKEAITKLASKDALYPLPESRFPLNEKESIEKISDFAKKHRITVESMKVDSSVVYSKDDGGQSGGDSKVCNAVPVSLVLSTRYEDLIKFIQTIKTYVPAYVTVEKLEIKKGTPEESDLLNIILNLYLYILS